MKITEVLIDHTGVYTIHNHQIPEIHGLFLCLFQLREASIRRLSHEVANALCSTSIKIPVTLASTSTVLHGGENGELSKY